MKIIAFLLIVFGPFSAFGQASLLESKITLSVQEERLDQCLKKIATAGGFTFSYNTAILEVEKRVSHQFINSTIREILGELFKGTVQYRARGKYIILTKAKMSSVNKEAATVSGYVVDEATGARLTNVSVYDPGDRY